MSTFSLVVIIYVIFLVLRILTPHPLAKKTAAPFEDGVAYFDDRDAPMVILRNAVKPVAGNFASAISSSQNIYVN